jgi:hypothetical protein
MTEATTAMPSSIPLNRDSEDLMLPLPAILLLVFLGIVAVMAWKTAWRRTKTVPSPYQFLAGNAKSWWTLGRNANPSPDSVRLIGMTRLHPRVQLHVVQWGETQYLLAVNDLAVSTVISSRLSENRSATACSVPEHASSLASNAE